MQIPKVEKGKSVIIRSQSWTGKVLNNDGSIYNNVGENYYLIMDSVEIAKKYAIETIKDGLVDVTIHDHNGEYIDTYINLDARAPQNQRPVRKKFNWFFKLFKR